MNSSQNTVSAACMVAATITGGGRDQCTTRAVCIQCKGGMGRDGCVEGRWVAGGSKWSFKGSKARPAREGARLVTRHQEETSSGV